MKQIIENKTFVLTEEELLKMAGLDDSWWIHHAESGNDEVRVRFQKSSS